MGGTKEFMSPELIAKSKGISRDKFTDRVDVFSYGVLIYEILTQQSLPLYHKPSLTFVNLNVLKENIKKLSDISLEINKKTKLDTLLKLIENCVKITATERPSMEQVLDDLNNLLVK